MHFGISDHSSNDLKAVARIIRIEISSDEKAVEEWLDSKLSKVFDDIVIR